MKRIVSALFFVCLLTVGVNVNAQLSTATMYGTVTDATGAVVPNAKVTVIQTDTHTTRTLTTNGDGSYRAAFLPVGPYRVSISATGFKTLNRTGITLTVTEEAEVNFTLQVGGGSTVIKVTGQAPLLNTTNSTLGVTVGNTEIENLPLVDRNVYQLLDLTPGVQSNNGLNNNQSSTNGGNAFNNLGYPEQHVIINGSTDSLVGQVSYYLDGGSNMTGVRDTGNPLPNPDAIQEFAVQTNNFSAAFGRSSAGVVTVITKSGTNNFHGSLFEFYRDRNFNATEHNVSPALGKTPYNQSRFGGTLGGPIRHNKMFFFGSYAGYRFVSSNILRSDVPSAAMDAGNFSENLPSGTLLTGTAACSKSVKASATTFYVCNPATRSAYPGNIVPVSDFDPAVYNIIKAGLIPTPHNGGQPGDTAYTARDFQRFTQQTDQEFAKVNDQLTTKQRLLVSYFHNTGEYVVNPSGNEILNWTIHHYNFVQDNADVQHIWTLTNNTVNQLFLGYTRLLGGRTATPDHSLAAFGSKFAEQLPDGSICGTGDKIGCSMPEFEVSGWFTAGNAITGPVSGSNVYLARDVVSSVHGRHSLTFGGDASLEKDAQETLLNNYGVFKFTQASAGESGRTSAAITDLFFGRPNSMNQDVPGYSDANYWNYGAFLQDDWRVIPTLTLNLGVRYDVQTAPVDTQRRQLNFKTGVQSIVDPTAPLGIQFVGDPGVPEGGATTKYNHVSPRVGFAWVPPGDKGKTVFHGGAGLFYGTVGGNLFDFPGQGEPFGARSEFKKVISVADPYTGDPEEFCANPNGGCTFGASPFPYTYNPTNIKFLVYPVSITAFAKNFTWPAIYQTNFGFQHQFTNNIGFSVSYVGSFERHAPFFRDINYPIWTPGAPSSAPKTSPENMIGADYPNTTKYVDNRRPFNQSTALGASPTLAANPTYSSVDIIESNQTSNYNALQVSGEIRALAGLTVKGFYIWSKSLAGASLDETGNVGNNEETAYEDPNLPYLERQRTDFDQRNVAVISFVYQPHFSQYDRFVRLAINGWTVSSIIRMQSGLPYNITTGVDTNADGNTYDRPNVYDRSALHVNRSHSRVAEETNWVSISAFCQSDRVTPISSTASNPACPQLGAGPDGIDGTLRDNTLDAPGRRSVDAAIFRNFPLFDHGRVQFQIRGESTNVFNLTNLPAPSSELTGGYSSFGHITGTIQSGSFSNRIIQVGGRIIF